MTPEQLEKRIKELENWKKSLEASHSIPLNVDFAFRTRLSNLAGVIALSSKAASSENVTIDEAGSGTPTVLDNPDAFLQVVVNNATYYIPVFT